MGINWARRVEGLVLCVTEGRGTDEEPIHEVLYLYIMDSEDAMPGMVDKGTDVMERLQKRFPGRETDVE